MLATLALAAATCVAAPLPEPAGGWAVASPLLAAQQPHQATPLSRPPPCSAYAPLDGEANYGIGAEEGWLRLRLPPTLDEPRLLLRFAGLEQVCVYWPRRQAAPLRDCRQRATPAGLGGSDIGWLLRPPADFDPAGEIQLGAIAPLWLKLPLEYGSAEGLARASHRRQYYWGLYYGLLLASAVMGLVTFAAQREKMYLIFAAHVGALGVAVALWQGRFVAWEFAGISSVGLAPMLMGLAVAAGALFHRDFMATARTAPRASRGFGLVAAAAVGSALLVPLAPASASSAIGGLALLWVGLTLGTAMLRAKGGAQSARYVLAGTSVLLAAIVINALQALGLPLASPQATNLWLYVGVLSSTLFLVVAMTRRVRTMTLERDAALQVLGRQGAQASGISAERQARLAPKLQSALSRGLLELHYQPILRGRSGQLVALEGLLRWPRGPELEPVGSAETVALAQASGIGGKLSDFVLQRALADMAAWRGLGYAVPAVAINLRAEDLSVELPRRVFRALAAWRLPPSALQLEITEQALVRNLERAGKVVEALCDGGVEVWVDDFGSGYSALNYLRSLPATGVKLDRAFLQDYPAHPRARQLVEAVLGLARDLGLKVIVEGVETAEQQQRLNSEGDLLLQGFHYAEPLDAPALRGWLQQRRQQATQANAA